MHDPASWAHDRIPCNCRNNNSLRYIVNPPISPFLAGLQINCNWPMRLECLRLGFVGNLNTISTHDLSGNLHKIDVHGIAENVHKISLHGWDMFSIISRHHRGQCVGSSSNRLFPICTKYAVVWRNILEPRFQIVGLNRAKHRGLVLRLCLSEPVAVIQDLHCWYTWCTQLPLLFPACPSSAGGLSHLPSVRPSTVAPSSPVQSPTLRKNVQTTSSLASRSSKAFAPSIEISKSSLPPSEYVSSLGMIMVHSRGIPDGLPGPLPPLPITPESQSQIANTLQVDPRMLGVVPMQSKLNLQLTQCVHYSCHQFVWISSLSKSHTSHTQLELSDNQ